MRIDRFNAVIETGAFLAACAVAVDEINRRGWLGTLFVLMAAWGIWVVIDERNGLRNSHT